MISIHFREVNRKLRKVSQLINEHIYLNPENKKVMLFIFTEHKFVYSPGELDILLDKTVTWFLPWGSISWASRPTAAEQTLWSSV